MKISLVFDLAYCRASSVWTKHLWNRNGNADHFAPLRSFKVHMESDPKSFPHTFSIHPLFGCLWLQRNQTVLERLTVFWELKLLYVTFINTLKKKVLTYLRLSLLWQYSRRHNQTPPPCLPSATTTPGKKQPIRARRQVMALSIKLVYALLNLLMAVKQLT